MFVEPRITTWSPHCSRQREVHVNSYGHGGVGVIGVILIIIVVLMLLGRI